jgi:GT2 family glycosyltransferase
MSGWIVGSIPAMMQKQMPTSAPSSEVAVETESRRGGRFARVDVFIPCYNYGRFLYQCVNSVLSQAGVDVRVLVIDDASPDNTAEVAAALAQETPNVSLIRHSTNRGHINTYNEGIEWASADYMLLLSADDYLLPGALRRATGLMEAHPEVGFTFGNVIELSDSGDETAKKSIIEATNGSDKRILEGREFIELSGADNLVATCTAVVRTEVQKRIGGYRDELPHAGDMEMWLRFAAHGAVGFISSYQGVYRQHSANMSTAYYYVFEGHQIYANNGRLADLQQRKSALDCFFEGCSNVLPCEHLYHRLYRQLSESAVRHASAAFNDGGMQESRQLSDFALAVYPAIKNSTAWVKLTCKRWMGARTWRAVSPAAAAMRVMQRK